MVPKLHAPPEVQLLVNTVMSWAETQLKTQGRVPAAAAWLPRDSSEPGFRTLEGLAAEASIARQEGLLAAELQAPWRRNELAAILLAAPVLYGRKGSTERTQAVRLHVEAAAGYCADILMPYRIRAAGRWRSGPRNRVHFSHPVAQESDSFAPV
jgi:hypothetical protein